MKRANLVSRACLVLDLLTVFRFCIDINSPRTLQTATEKLFLAVSQHAKEVPIIVVATKKDEFLDVGFSLNHIMTRIYVLTVSRRSNTVHTVK